MEQILILLTVIVPIVTAFLQAVKMGVNLPKSIVPLVSIVLGLLVGFASYPFTDLGVDLRLWAGALAGLASVGLFEVGKQVKPVDTSK